MPGRALPAAPAAPQPPTGPQGPSTHSSQQRSLGPQRSLARLAPGTSRFWPRRCRARGSPRRRRRTKAAPGRMLLSDSPCAERLQRARAGLCAAPASWRRVGARRRPSPRLLPFAALLSSSAHPAPAPLAVPGSRRRRCRRLGDRRCGAPFTAAPLGPPSARQRPQQSVRRAPGRGRGAPSARAPRALRNLDSPCRCRAQPHIFALRKSW
nr:PREDICTED: uncharacterized protein LOC103540968 isoform X1 [Equus przewalskii]XP_008505894.1 PREDICTED: uncharacterized protein LOC103540968 isoform X2 [Equus przewalskii]